MANGQPNKVLLARAAAILTTAEVAASRLDLNESFNSLVHLQVDFTLGSLTNVIVKAYTSMDGTNWYQIHHPAAATPIAATYTASIAATLPFDCQGWKFFRASMTGTGTVTSSSATLTYRYLRRGTQ